MVTDSIDLPMRYSSQCYSCPGPGLTRDEVLFTICCVRYISLCIETGSGGVVALSVDHDIVITRQESYMRQYDMICCFLRSIELSPLRVRLK